VQQASNEIDFDGNKYIASAIDLSTVSENNYASGTSTDEYMLPIFPELSFTVDAEGILHNAESMSIADNKAVFVQECPPELALSAVELSLTPKKKRRYNEAFQLGIDMPNDKVFHTWKSLKTETPIEKTSLATSTSVPLPSKMGTVQTSKAPPFKDVTDSAPIHPLVRAGLISPDLVDILVVPKTSTPISKTRINKKTSKARVLTSTEVQQEVEAQEKRREEEEKAKQQRKLDRVKRKMEKEAADAKRKEEMKIKKEMREKTKAEKKNV
jgi:hypothetical protein